MAPRSDRRYANTVLSRNLRSIIDAQAEGSVNRWAISRKIPQATLNRAVIGQSDMTSQVIERVAKAAGYKAWQLLLPNFDPAATAPLADAAAMRVAAVYASIKDPKDRARLSAVVEQFAPDEIRAPADEEPPVPAAKPARVRVR